MVTAVKRQEVREGPSGRRYNLPQEIQAWEADWAASTGQPHEDLGPAEPRRRGTGEGDPDPARKALHDEAVSFIRDYRGTWGFILDLRASPKWATKYFRLSERQVEVVLASKARDAARAEDPRVAAIVSWLKVQRDPGYGFMSDMALRARTGVGFSPRQLDVLERIKTEHEVTVRTTVGVAPSEPITDGIYRTPDGTVIKVQKAVHGSGNLYGKRLVIDGDHGSFVYEPGLLKRITAEMKLSLDDAAEFGRLYGFCIVCGATLTDENSIARGIGPICAGRF